MPNNQFKPRIGPSEANNKTGSFEMTLMTNSTTFESNLLLNKSTQYNQNQNHRQSHHQSNYQNSIINRIPIKPKAPIINSKINSLSNEGQLILSPCHLKIPVVKNPYNQLQSKRSVGLHLLPSVKTTPRFPIPSKPIQTHSNPISASNRIVNIDAGRLNSLSNDSFGSSRKVSPLNLPIIILKPSVDPRSVSVPLPESTLAPLSVPSSSNVQSHLKPQAPPATHILTNVNNPNLKSSDDPLNALLNSVKLLSSHSALFEHPLYIQPIKAIEMALKACNMSDDSINRSIGLTQPLYSTIDSILAAQLSTYRAIKYSDRFNWAYTIAAHRLLTSGTNTPLLSPTPILKVRDVSDYTL